MRCSSLNHFEFGRALRKLSLRLVEARGPVRGDPGSRADFTALTLDQPAMERRVLPC